MATTDPFSQFKAAQREGWALFGPLEMATTLPAATAGPLVKLMETLQGETEKLARFRGELEALIADYYADNAVSQHFLITRAIKRQA